MGRPETTEPSVGGPGLRLNIESLPFADKMLMGTTKDDTPLTLASIAERQWGLEDRQMGLMEDQFLASTIGGGIQAVTQIISAFLQWDIMSDQMDLQDRAMTLQEKVTDHKIALDLLVVEKQDALANKQLTNQVELARIEKSRAHGLAQIQEDGRTERNLQKMAASKFPAYNYGNPYQAVAV